MNRTSGVARSCYGSALLGSADMLGNFSFLLHEFYPFIVLCLMPYRDLLLAHVRTPDEMARVMKTGAVLLSPSHAITQPVRWSKADWKSSWPMLRRQLVFLVWSVGYVGAGIGVLILAAVAPAKCFALLFCGPRVGTNYTLIWGLYNFNWMSPARSVTFQVP